MDLFPFYEASGCWRPCCFWLKSSVQENSFSVLIFDLFQIKWLSNQDTFDFKFFIPLWFTKSIQLQRLIREAFFKLPMGCNQLFLNFHSLNDWTASFALVVFSNHWQLLSLMSFKMPNSKRKVCSKLYLSSRQLWATQTDHLVFEVLKQLLSVLVQVNCDKDQESKHNLDQRYARLKLHGRTITQTSKGLPTLWHTRTHSLKHNFGLDTHHLHCFRWMKLSERPKSDWKWTDYKIC